uniref:Uncharacterized protein n=1 Tax=Picea sitchensis TaxID=3332 RepID=D5A8X4_PICSI|nr:unknown [Picea sitchensis]
MLDSENSRDPCSANTYSTPLQSASFLPPAPHRLMQLTLSALVRALPSNASSARKPRSGSSSV